MLIKLVLFFTSLIFLIIKLVYIKILNKSKFQTYPGYFLLKTKIDFLNLYLKQFTCPIVFVTGTNGKTSTNHLLNHLLTNLGFKTFSNTSGSNLKRGVLSTLVLNYLFFIFKKPDFLVFELDEGSILDVFKSIPNTLEKRYLILLNLSRDQLDRYGEIDIVLNRIKNACNNYNFNLIGFSSNSVLNVDKGFVVNKNINNTLISKLAISNEPHLINNLSFVTTLFNILNIQIATNKITAFNLVKGRGSEILLFGNKYFVNLCKNPASFNNTLKNIQFKDIKNVLIVLNDNIPDGRDVSWFYDIDFNLLKKVLKGKQVFVAGSRGYDFYNLLKICGISCFNTLDFKNYVVYANHYKLISNCVLSNYSATYSILKYAENI